MVQTPNRMASTNAALIRITLVTRRSMQTIAYLGRGMFIGQL